MACISSSQLPGGGFHFGSSVGAGDSLDGVVFFFFAVPGVPTDGRDLLFVGAAY